MSSGHLNAQYNLRLPDELKQKIAESAQELNRSMNADIVARLEESFGQKFGDLESVPTEELMKELAKRLDGFSIVAVK
ncbi:Arc family DNA-binding protein [Acinetobacter sp. ANC 5033]|uniref:Arc family DNA-binding protein n=1 Tax=Acinetobacter amyesii TaxID=2942470 RepID=UPI00201B78D6|nr:Arc family DNA-binding protein [Acinetobacter amyesii]MCL6237095.1 Arc family DNA-binding protein [Acinetobacter amyesii]